MEENKLYEILDYWNFWTREQYVGVQRKRYLDVIRPFLKTNQAVALTGVRRSGKSTIMLQLAKELINSGVDPRNILIVNFEDYRWEECSLSLLEHIYEAYLQKINKSRPFYLFLDEVHKVPSWERFVRTLIDKKEAKIVLSDSNIHIMSRELGTLLTGRHVEIKVFPPSFEEFLEFRKLQVTSEIEAVGKKLDIKKLIDESMAYGFFPEVILTDDENAKKKILVEYLEGIITKDVAERHKIKEKEKLRSLARFYLTSSSSPISFNKLKEPLRLPLRTIERFSYYLEEAYVLSFLKRFSLKVKEQEKSPRKVYSIDLGLMNAYGFYFMENKSRIMENFVFLELIKKGKEIYYWKNVGQEEVDFVIKDGFKVTQLIQVCFNIQESETKQREIKALIKASKELQCSRLLVITSEHEGEEKAEWFGDLATIRYIPLWKWLLTCN